MEANPDFVGTGPYAICGALFQKNLLKLITYTKLVKGVITYLEGPVQERGPKVCVIIFKLN